MATSLLLKGYVLQKRRSCLYAFARQRAVLTLKKWLADGTIRVQSPEGVRRIEIPPASNLQELFESVQRTLQVHGFGLFLERNFKTELRPNSTQTVGALLKHGDMLYIRQTAGTSSSSSSSPSPSGTTTALAVQEERTAAPSSSSTSGVSVSWLNNSNGSKPTAMGTAKPSVVIEDDVDLQLYKMDGTIQRERDPRLCSHNRNSRCVHCTPLAPYDETYVKEHNIKHLSFHSYIRKQTSGIDHGKYFAFNDIECRIKPGCRDHLPWPKGICSKCQPSAITLNRQTYRHVDNIMFENATIVERFLNYWRLTGNQRVGYLYGRYEVHPDVPLGIRAVVAAIYEPPQQSTRNSLQLTPDEAANDVEFVAAALGLKKVGWIFTDLIPEDANSGTVKQVRGIETHFLTAQECITAANFQNRYPNPCKYASNGVFGSKFVTVCVTGDNTKQVHMEGYAVSAQCMALVRDNCLVPTKDAPELGYVRESSEKQYVPDVFYSGKDKYGNDVQQLARPLPVEYLLVDVPASTPVQPQYTFTQYDQQQSFLVENRPIEGHTQSFYALANYLARWTEEQFLEALSDFHLLLFLYISPVVELRDKMSPLLQAVRNKNANQAAAFKQSDAWSHVEALIRIDSQANGTTRSRASSRHSGSHGEDSDVEMPELTWVCAHCTFINTGPTTTCEMCSLPK